VYLRKEITREQKTRLDFNEQHYRYLPPNLKALLEEPPTRYEVYPNALDLGSSQALLDPVEAE
jgi:hypothetical protein